MKAEIVKKTLFQNKWIKFSLWKREMQVALSSTVTIYDYKITEPILPKQFLYRKPLSHPLRVLPQIATEFSA